MALELVYLAEHRCRSDGGAVKTAILKKVVCVFSDARGGLLIKRIPVHCAHQKAMSVVCLVN